MKVIFIFSYFLYGIFVDNSQRFYFIFTAVGDVRLHLAQGLSRLPNQQLSVLLGQISEVNANYLKNYLQSTGTGTA